MTLAPERTELASGQRPLDAHTRAAAGTTSPATTTGGSTPMPGPSSRGTLPDPASVEPIAKDHTPGREQTTGSGHGRLDTHRTLAAPGANLPADQEQNEVPISDVGGGSTWNGSAATATTAPKSETLADPFLALAADIVDDAERSRIANENRLRHLTRTEADEDGEVRGLGMDESHPDVARVAALVEMLGKIEHQAVLNLNRLLRQHPLGPWIRAQKGVGDKTAARLLAVIGDPYVNVQTSEVRTVSQLWAYCGHGDPGRRKFKGMGQEDLFRLGNPTAKKRVWLIATAILKAGGGEEKATRASDSIEPTLSLAAVYYYRKADTEGREHATECVRCGPSGKPAPAGSPWSDAHRHADALRIVGKEFLRELWLEAKRIHEEPA